MISTGADSTGRTQWFASWFDSSHYHRLYGYRDEREAARFVAALTRNLAPGRGAKVLDLGCGAGRHAHQLAATGLRVTGIDLAASSIAEARRSAAPGLRFFRHDMRHRFGRCSYDYVFNLFTSFGYFDARTHDRIIGNIARALKPGGRLVLDYLNVGFAEQALVAKETVAVDGVTYDISRWTDAGHFFKRIVVDEGDGNRAEHIERVAKFTLGDFHRMLSARGLWIHAVYGDYSLHEYDPCDSPRMILVARKMAEAAATEGRDRTAVPPPLLRREVLANPAEGLG